MAVLVLFTTFSLIKVSTLGSLQPDLRRIGINVGPSATANPIAEDETTNPNQADSPKAGTLTAASGSLEIDADVDIDSEGDTPTYIE